MPNKAIHQLPGTNQRLAGDRYPLVRDLGGGTWADRYIDDALIPRGLIEAQTVVTSAEILALNATPIDFLGGQGAGTYIVPEFAILTLENATVDYATNVNVVIGAESDTSVGAYLLSGVLPLIATPSVLLLANFINNQRAAMAAGDGLRIHVLTGDPTAGDGDIRVTVYYRLF